MQLSITEKGQYAVAYGLSCKKDCHELHTTDPRRTIPHPIPVPPLPIAEIAKQLNRHKSTISREIKRHRTQGQQYSAEKAQKQSRLIKQRKRKPYKLDSQLIQHIDTLIRRKLSPEQVCAYLCKHHQITLHHSTIYRYLRQDKSNGGTLWQHLRMRPLQNISLHLFADSQNPNTGFRLFPLLITPDFTQIPPIPLGYLINQASRPPFRRQQAHLAC